LTARWCRAPSTTGSRDVIFLVTSHIGVGVVRPCVLAFACVSLPQVGSFAFPAEDEPSWRYVDLVSRYAAGEHAETVAALGTWTEHDLEREVDALRRLGLAAQHCAACKARLQLDRVSLRAAVMLHTDRDEVERRPLSLTGQNEARCSPGAHAALAEHLLALVLSQSNGREFARRWYLGMTLRAHRDTCLEEGLRWAKGGLRWFPRDAELLLSLGTLFEVRGMLLCCSQAATDPLAFRATSQWLSQRQQAISVRIAQREDWDEARRSFEEALAAEAHLEEAMLHLSRVRWRLGQAEAARAPLVAVLRQSKDSSLLYLAHLFLGQLHEDASHLGEAEREYRAALALDPLAQAAAVALSHVRQLSGDVATSRRVLERALDHAGSRRGDPYWDYPFGRTATADTIFETLRRETQQ